MTTELERKFYDTFGIEPFTCCDEGCKTIGFTKNCDLCPYNKRQYPRIDNYIFLKLICIVFNTFQSFEINRIYTVETLKDKILSLLILSKDDVYNQIQQLFKGE